MSAAAGREHRVSTRGLAELAGAGYLLARGPATQVEFEVHHTADAPGYLLSLIKGELAETGSSGSFAEVVTCAANGVSVVVGTRTGVAASQVFSSDADESPVGRPAVAATANIRASGHVFPPGRARPNPTFTFDTALTFEAIISLDQRQTRVLTFGRSVLVKDLLAYVSRVAADAGVALAAARWPAQLPPRTSTKPGEHDVRARDERQPPHAFSHALRFSFALNDSSAQLRIRLGVLLKDYAQQRGFGLWLSDTRPGHRAGNWFQICSVTPPPSPAEPDPVADRAVDLCLPVTFVGPARVGSTSALLRLLGALPFVGIAGCVNTTLNDLAFVHLQLALRGIDRRRSAEVDQELAGRLPRSDDPWDILTDVLDRLGFAGEIPHGHRVRSRRELAAKAYDYKTYVGSVFPCLPLPARRRMALWFSWQIQPDERGLETMLDALYRALIRIGLRGFRHGRARTSAEAPNLEYLICRTVGGAMLRCRGKLSLPKDLVDHLFGREPVEPPASKLAALLEAAWKAELSQGDGLLELSVAWREYWLGHWSSTVY